MGNSSLRLSEQGQKIVRKAIREKYGKLDYAQLAEDADHISTATAKRWSSKKRVKVFPENFKNLCQALDLNWKDVVEQRSNPEAVPSSDVALLPHETKRNKIYRVSFYGRANEIKRLEKWVLQEKCRLVGIVGLGGIGKTEVARLAKGGIGKSELSQRFAKRVENEFEHVVWQSILNAPSIHNLLLSFLDAICDQEPVEIPETAAEQVHLLIQYLKRYRCLLVLDNFESVLEVSDGKLGYRRSYDGYRYLLQEACQKKHKSCVLITSRETPDVFNSTDSKGSHLLRLSGLSNHEATNLLKEIGLFASSAKEWKHLAESYCGNPLALQLAAKYIQVVFRGDISRFIQENIIAFGQIEDLIEWHFDKLSEEEQEAMYWLATLWEPFKTEELKEKILSTNSKRQLGVSLSSLFSRFLIVEDNSIFSLQPVILEYTIQRLIKLICREFEENNIFMLHRNSLFQAQSKDYVRNIQNRTILQPILSRLLDSYGEKDVIKKQAIEILESKRNNKFRHGYLGGNIINLLCQGDIDLANMNFSNLKIKQAYLQDSLLHHVNFAGASFQGVVFKQVLGNVNALAFSADGAFIAVGDTNYNVSVWNVETGTLEAILSDHTEWVRSVEFDPFDRNKLYSGSEDRSVKIWNIKSKQCLKTFNPGVGIILSISLCSKGKKLACSGSEGKIGIWDLEKEESQKIWLAHDGVARVWSIAWSSDDKYIVTGAQDSKIKIWNAKTKKIVQQFSEHVGTVQSVWFCQDNEKIVSCADDGLIKVWSLTTSECLTTITQQDSGICSAAVNPLNVNQIIGGFNNSSIQGFDLSTGDCFRTFYGHDGPIQSVAFSPQGNVFATGGGATIKIWETINCESIRTIRGTDEILWSASFSQDGGQIASGWSDGRIIFWDVKEKKIIHTTHMHSSDILALQFSSDGRYLISGSDDTCIKLWDAVSYEWIRDFTGHEGKVRAVAFSHDSKLAVSGSFDGTVKLWNIFTGECLKTLHKHTSRIWSIACSSDGTLFASGDDEGKIALWSLESGEFIQFLEGHQNWVRGLCFSPDNKLLASGSNDKTARIWDLRTHKEIDIIREHNAPVYSVSFNSDGSLLAMGSDEVRVCDVKSDTNLKTFTGHTRGIMAVQFCPHTAMLLSASVDNTINLWKQDPSISFDDTLRPPRVYEGMNIRKAKGLNYAEKKTLKSLGAIDH